MAIAKIIPRQIFNDVATLQAAAREALPDFAAYLERMAKRYECDFVIGPLKTDESLNTKFATHSVQNEPAAGRDYCRGMMIVPDNKVKKIQRIANDMHPKINPQIKGIVDIISGRELVSGFRALYIYPEMPNGHICEVIIMPECMKRGYDQTKELYRAFRNLLEINGPREKLHYYEDEWELLDEMEAIYKKETTRAFKKLKLEEPA